MPTPERKSNSARFLLVAVLALLGLTLTAASFHFDGWARESIVAMQGKHWKKSVQREVQGAVSRYGDWPWLMVAGGAGLFFAWRMRNRGWQRILVTAMIASTAAGLMVNAARLTTGRTRPNAGKEIAQGWYGPFHEGRLTVGNSKYNSFPSGHTATAVGFAGVLLFARPWAGALAMIAAFGIAWSRMLLGAHHLSDVTVGTLCGLIVAWICWWLAVRRGDAIAAWVKTKLRRIS